MQAFANVSMIQYSNRFGIIYDELKDVDIGLTAQTIDRTRKNGALYQQQ